MRNPLKGRGITRRRQLLVGGLALALAVPVISATSAVSVGAAPNDPVVVYDSIGATTRGNTPSTGFEATSTSELGDAVRLAPGPRALTSVTVDMSSWACQTGTGLTCTTTPGATFTHPLTLNVYAVSGPDSAPVISGLPIATATGTFTIPYRPSADPTCADQTQWHDAANSACYSGKLAPVTFTFPGTIVPSRIVWTIAYNTTHHGYAPIGEGASCYGTTSGCPYDSLNVADLTLSPNAFVGTDLDESANFVSSTWSGEYCHAAGGVGVLRNDGDPTACDGPSAGSAGYRPLATIVAKPVTSTSSTVVVDPQNSHGWRFIDDGADKVIGSTFVTGPTTPPLGTGSAELTTTPGQQRMVATNAYAGTKLANITQLDYSIFQQSAPDTESLTLAFDVQYDPAVGGYHGRLTYEPSNGNTPVVQGWNSIQALSGKWWASKNGVNDSNGKCDQTHPCTWAQIQDNWPTASILGALLVRNGSSVGWTHPLTSDVDNVTIGVDDGAGNITTTVNNFENTAAPAAVTTTVLGNTIGGENNTTAEWSYDHIEPKVPGTESVVTDAAPVAAAAGNASLTNGNLKLSTLGFANTTLSQQARVAHTFDPATAPRLIDVLASRPSYSVFAADQAGSNGQANFQFGFQCGGWTGAVLISPPDLPGVTLDDNGSGPLVNTWQTYHYPSATDATGKVFVSTDGGTAPAGFAGFTAVKITDLITVCGDAKMIDARASMGRNTYPSATSYLDNLTFLGHTYDFVTAVAPAITSGAPTAAAVGTPYSFTFTATGAPTPVITSSGTLPAGLTLTNGVLSGTPTAGGTFTFLVKASNGVLPDASQLVTVTVSPIPTAAPTITSFAPVNGTVGTAYTFTFTATGTPAPTFSTAGGALPAGLTLSPAGVLSGTPTTAGTFTFLLRASNGVLPPADALTTVTINQVASEAPLGAATPVAVTPARLLDTRLTTTPASGSTTNLKVTGIGGVPSNAQAVFLNVTAVGASAPGFVTVWAGGTDRPGTSNLNVATAGQTIPNMVVTPVGVNGDVNLYVQNRTDLIVDVMGYIPAGIGYTAVTPTRVLDTRDTVRPGNGATTSVPVTSVPGAPAGATAVIMNVTDVNTSGAGYLTVWPSGATQPTTSNLNVDHAGQTRPNLVIVPIGADGKVNVFQQTSADLVVDVVGYFTPEANYNAIQPSQRVLDTRTPVIGYTGAKPDAGATVTVKVAGVGAVPADVKYVVVNLTADQASGAGYVTVFPGGVTAPTASNLNLDGSGSIAANLAFVPVGADGNIQLFTQSGTHLIVDVFGWVK
ncbi:MAG: N-acetylmuramoyl-L-alanine amidase [Ilumatobacteraceae bacterium]|nr:N-acetylmuramoyl-L-alanine amidase [Ilumatobacteraceae bacterium]